MQLKFVSIGLFAIVALIKTANAHNMGFSGETKEEIEGYEIAEQNGTKITKRWF